MNRRQFLARSAIIAAGAVAADQLDLVERLGWRRRFFAGWSRPILYTDSIHDDTEAIQALLDGREVYDLHRREVIGGAHASYFVSGRSVRVTRTLYAGQPGQHGSGLFHSCHFHGDEIPGPLLHIRETKLFARGHDDRTFNLEA